MGAVWKALDVVLGRSVAVKEVLLPPTRTDEENDIARERALREARSIAALSHPNVVTLYDVVEDDGRPWVVMELVPAKNLAEIIRDDGTLQPTEAARIGLAVLAALQSAHEVGITHRDVKPGNILVSPDGRVKLADFGISRRAEDSALTRTGLMVGSPSYIAPEVARGRAATSAADIWGLGATLQCAVEGRPPFDLGDPVATLTAVVGDPPAPAPHAGPLQPLITRMLQKDPRDRIRPEEARRTLEEILAARPAPPPTYSPPSGPVATPSGGRRSPNPSGAQPSGAQPVPGRPGRQGPGSGVGPAAAGAGGVAGGYLAAHAPQPEHRPARPTSQAMRAQGTPPSQPMHAQGGPPSQTVRAQGGPASQTVRRPAQQTSGPVGQGVYGAGPAPRASYGAATSQQPLAPGPSTGRTKRRGGNPWIAALIGLLLAVVIGGAIILWVSNDNTSDGGSGSAASSNASIATPTSNDTKIAGTTASGAINVDGMFRPFSLELPDGWEAVEVPAEQQDSRSEFIQSDSGDDPATMIKVTVVAETLDGASVDEHIKAQMNQIGSPAKLPGFSEVSYEVTSQGNVLWQYENKLQGSERLGFLYATLRGEDILWKVLTSGPSDTGQDTADIANDVIKTFTA